MTLEMSLRGTRYRVRRTPEYQRPKRRGAGFVTEAAQVHLERLEAGGWTSLSANKAEAGEAIRDAIGLTQAQFTQVMLLRQGEFAKFLRSSGDDRQKLLTALFGTQLYDRITDELGSRRTDATRAREAAQRQIAAAAAAAAEAAGLDEAARDELLALSRGDRAARLAEVTAQVAADSAASRRGTGRRHRAAGRRSGRGRADRARTPRCCAGWPTHWPGWPGTRRAGRSTRRVRRGWRPRAGPTRCGRCWTRWPRRRRRWPMPGTRSRGGRGWTWRRASGSGPRAGCGRPVRGRCGSSVARGR